MFLQEVQVVWPELRPYLGARATGQAELLGLPTDPDRFAGLVPPDDVSRLVAALVRTSFRHREPAG